MSRTTSTLSGWIASLGAFSTLLMAGSFRGVYLTRDDLTAIRIIPDRTVRHLDMHHGGVQRYRGSCSPARLQAAMAACTATCKRSDYRAMTLAEALEDNIFGACVPTMDEIVKAYTEA